MEPRTYTSHEVATLMQVSPSAVLRWIDGGLLRAFRTPGGHRRVSADALRAFLHEQAMPVPSELEPARVGVLVIDDEPGYLTSLGATLRRADPRLEVDLAESAVDGLLKIGLQRPDVVLLDAYMPGMDGLEVCRRIKASRETARIAVVAMSGRRSDELVARFQKAGADSFLPKPLTTAAVLEQLQVLGLLTARAARPP